MKEDLDTIIIKSLFTWRDFIQKEQDANQRRIYINKFNGLYRYAKSYSYKIPDEIEHYQKELQNDSANKPRGI